MIHWEAIKKKKTMVETLYALQAIHFSLSKRS